jgi:hypothetical protein
MNRFILLLSVPLLAVSAVAQQADTAAPPQDAQAQINALNVRVEALEGAPAPASIASFNPAMGMALDSVYLQNGARSGFQLRAAELGIEAPVDPYLTGSAIITGSNDGFELENAELKTTSLPYNLAVRGGRFFASFGRLPHFHDHELPMVQRPPSIDTYIGGESHADGLEVSWLFPTDTYISATFGAYNKLGADNARVDNTGTRRMSEFTYLGRLNAYSDISDNQSLEMGVSSAFTPRRVVASGGNDTWRTLNGMDLTYRYQPADSGIYHGLLWGTEVLQNDEMRLNPTSLAQLGRKTAYAGYTYLQMKAGRHWVPGAMLDLTENPDDPHLLTRTAEAFVQYDVTEFQTLRLAYSYAASNTSAPDNKTLMLQWTAVLGHHVHGFDMRSL